MAYADKTTVTYWGKQQSVPTIGAYTNDTESDKQITKINAYLGVGVSGQAYTWGTKATGTGQPASVYFSLGGVSSATVTVTNTVAAATGTGGTYPIVSQCKLYEITLSSPLVVKPGQTVDLTFPSLTGTFQNVVMTDHKRFSVTVEDYNLTNTVHYNANGGSGIMEDSIATRNQPFITRPNAFTRSYHNFNGYNEQPDGSSRVWGLSSPGVYESGQSIVWSFTYDITLHAQWTPYQHTISYDANGGSGAPANQIKTYGL